MNWTQIDHSTQATEVPGAGCFVMFFNRDIVFAPGVTIKEDKKKGRSLVASPICGTHISFTGGNSDGTVWFGDAGEKLDKKMKAMGLGPSEEPEISLTTFDIPLKKQPQTLHPSVKHRRVKCRGQAAVDMKKFGKMKFKKTK